MSSKKGSTVTAGSRERRWLVVAEDGRHATMGRNSDPFEAEIETAGKRLDDLGLAAWLVISEGVYYSEDSVTLMVVRPITARTADWAVAEQRWHELRKVACNPNPPAP